MQKEVEDIRTFLSAFKTQKCKTLYYHDLDSCFYYHDQRDQRKKPYSIKNQILYLPEFCTNQQPHDISFCYYCHNYYEYHFHPLIFKRDPCQFFHQCQKLYCPFRHYKQDLRNQFFRFDLNTFKVYECKNEHPHRRKACLFYHSNTDRRRSNFEEYQHVQCKNGLKCTNQHCQYSHNKIQQLFHPKRYKTKFCETMLNGKQCNYRHFCSFAHNNQEITIKLLDDMPKNTQFDLFYYKTVWCPYTNQHGRQKCVYAHNIQDYRRNPKNFQYLPEKCKYWKKNQNIKSLEEAGCPDGMQCKYCHGWKEYDYHPIIYQKKKSIMMGSTSYQPKRKGSQMIKQEQIVNKKLVLQDEGEVKNNKLQQIIHDKLQVSNQRNNAFFNGMPFFKAADNSSYGSKTTKAKSERFCNSENDKLSQVEERGSEKNMSLNCQKTDFAIFSDNDQYNKHCQIFKMQQNEKNTLKQRVVSRSCGKKQEQQIQYSQQVYGFIDIAIAEKLRKAKINEIKLLNLKQRDIQQLKCLSPREKSILIQKLKEFSLKQKQITQYSKTLKKVFIQFDHELLLKKMSMKKVKEDKMMKLQNKQIQDLSFLTEEQKRDLPLIIHFANSEIEFQEINRQITQAVKKQREDE